MELKVQLIIEILNLQQRIDLTEMDFMEDIYLQLISQRQDELKLLAEVEWFEGIIE